MGDSCTLSDIQSARSRVEQYLVETPLVRAFALERVLGLESKLFLKCENFQLTGSFKPRGAFNALLKLSPQEVEQGVIAASSGNFAQALACGGSRLGIQVSIVMPKVASDYKRQATLAYGAEVIDCGPTHYDRDAKVAEVMERTGQHRIHPYDDFSVIAGQGTLGLELVERLPNISTFFCPVGGGGLLAGSAMALKECLADVAIIAAEPEGARDFTLSFECGERTSFDQVSTIADGLRAALVGERNWPILKEYVDQARLVTEDDIRRAMQLLYEHIGIVVEPSGAVALAAIMNAEPDVLGPEVVCVISGGNVARKQFQTLCDDSPLA